jgi:glycosyltransferase involved in cell wall biosynthesis
VDRPGLSIVVPAHDEAATIVATVESLRAVAWHPRVEIIVVDDGSTDGTAARLAPLAASGAVRLLGHPSRRGRGAALRTGVAAASGEILAFHDGDGEYSAEDLHYVIGFIQDGRADAVFGSRTLGPGRTVMQYWRARAAGAVTVLSNALTNLNLTDATTSCVALRRGYWDRLTLRAEGFDLDVELIAGLARAGARIWEVPVSYAGRYREDGRKSRRRHTVRRMWRVVTSWWRRGSLLRESGQ